MTQIGRRPRVLFVGNFLSAHVGTTSVSETLFEQLRSRGWTVYRTSTKVRPAPRLADMIATTWRERARFDVAHVDVFSGKAFLWAEAVCAVLRSVGKPYVLSLHGGGLPRFAARSSWRVAGLLSSARCVTAPSAFLAEALAPFRRDIRVLPNAIDLGRYPFVLRESARPHLMWLRAFQRIYNPELLVRAAAQLRPEFSDLQVTMVGPDKRDGTLEAVRAAVVASGLQDRVTILGPVPQADVSTVLQGGDVFVNTSDTDNTPVSVIEALACGLCVVSTDVGGIPRLLTNRKDALLVPPDSPSELASAVRDVLTSPKLAMSLSRSGRNRAAALEWAVIVLEWERLFEEIATQRPCPSSHPGGF